MIKSKALRTFLVILLLGGNLFFGYQYFSTQSQLSSVQKTLKEQRVNEKTLEFLKMFVAKVLKSDGEVDFEERLTLENAVRQLGDSAIVEQWKKFTDSQTELEAQREVKNLLELLVNQLKK